MAFMQREWVCYRIVDNILQVHIEYTFEDLENFIIRNTGYKYIDSILIEGLKK